MVGVQRHGDRVPGGDDVGELGQCDRAGDHVLDPQPGGELGATGGELDDAVTAGVGETLDRGVDAFEPTQLIAGNANAFALARSSISA